MSLSEENTNQSSQAPSKSYQRLSSRQFDQLIKDVNTSINAETLAKDLFGQQNFNSNMSNSERLHFGRKGSLVVNKGGEYAGRFKDFESGEHGNLIQLVQREKALKFKNALTYVSSYISSPSVVQRINDFSEGKPSKTLIDWDEVLKDELNSNKAEQEGEAKMKRINEHEKDQAKKGEEVREIIAQCVPIKGTRAESYLRNERAIQGELSDSLRYLPAGSKFYYNGKNSYVRDGALAAVAKDSDGNHKAVQVTYLTKEGKRAETPDGEKFPKLSYGSLKGTSVQLQIGEKGSPVIIAEGVETALSLKEAGVKGDILCSLGTSNIKNLDVKNRDVIIAGDWDGSFEKPSWAATEKAKSALVKKGNKVEIILPVQDSELSNEKVDFNDLLKKGGVKSVVDHLSEQAPRLVTSLLPPREINQENHSRSKDGTSIKLSETTNSPLEQREPKGFQDKTKSFVAPSLQPVKSNPFKTNSFDVKSCTSDDFGRGR